MADLVHIIHPDLPNAPASVQARAAFERTFKDKGWREVTPKEASAHDSAIEAGEPSPLLAKPVKARAGGDA